MRRISMMLTVAAAFAAVLVMSAIQALGQTSGAHFTGSGESTCAVSGSTVQRTGKLAGLGNEDLSSRLASPVMPYTSARTRVVITIAPGQNKVLTGPATGTTMVPSGAIKNERAKYTTDLAMLSAPATVSGEAAGCSNPNCTGVNPTLVVTS
jgi:hypothetical protein